VFCFVLSIVGLVRAHTARRQALEAKLPVPATAWVALVLGWGQVALTRIGLLGGL